VPLVVERDGTTYRMLGGLVIEERVNGKAGTQYYPHRDYTSSVRVVTDGTGAVAASLGYDGDWGLARIQGQDYVASDAGMEAFYRFQSQEAEVFPLSALNISDEALESWLDELQLHHFPYREYSAGPAIFLSHDPAGQSISPYAAFGANPANITDPTGAIFNWIRSHPWARTAFWTLVWGTTSGLANAFLRPFLPEDETALMWDVVILGGGRYLANVVDGWLSTRFVRIGVHEVMVRGVAMLRNISTYENTARDFRYICLLEVAEALTGGLLGWPDSGAVAQYFFSFVGYVIADIFWGQVREAHISRHFPEVNIAYYMADHTGESVNRLRYLWGDSLVDAFFYSAMVVAWKYVFQPGDTDIGQVFFGVMWWQRNFGFRIARILIWDNLVLGGWGAIRPDNRWTLVTYQQYEYRNIYIELDDQGNFSEAFVWNWREGAGNINLEVLLNVRDQYIGYTGDSPAQSWQEHLHYLYRPTTPSPDIQVDVDESRPMLQGPRDMEDNEEEEHRIWQDYYFNGQHD